MRQQLPKPQISILHCLRHSKAERFSDLMRPTGMESDSFKFHMRKLVTLGLVQKTEAGLYRLTADGKEFANNLDETIRGIQRQPKASVLLLVSRPGPDGKRQFLFQQRLRAPYYGFWSCIGGPIQWGEDAEDTAARELLKQTGLTGACEVRAFYRKRDYRTDTRQLLEDKLFVILEATHLTGTLCNDWYAGHNEWMTADEFARQPQHFDSVLEAIQMIQTGQSYTSRQVYYDVRQDY